MLPPQQVSTMGEAIEHPEYILLRPLPLLPPPSPPPQIVTTGEADEDPEYVPLVTGKDMPTRRRLEVGPDGQGEEVVTGWDRG